MTNQALKFNLPEPMRVNKWLAQSGICSRRKAEELIQNAQIKINGLVVTDVGRKIQNGEVLEIVTAGQDRLSGQLSIIYHKPINIVSGQPQSGEVPAIAMLKASNRIGEGRVPTIDDSIPPVGRLDKDSRGLLILSQDGALVRKIIAPDSGIEKEYIVKVIGEITDKKIQKLCHGLTLDGRQLRPAKVSQIDINTLNFILKEGRNRQIRRMCAKLGLEVCDLFRIRIGNLKLGDLAENYWRHLTLDEITSF